MNTLFIRICSHISGAEIYNLNLLKVLATDSNQNISFITNNYDFSIRLAKLGIRTKYLPAFNTEIGTKREFIKAFLWFPMYILVYILQIKHLESDMKFDLICLQSTTEKILLTPILKILRYKVIWIEHGPFFSTDRFILVKILYTITSKFVNKILAVSDGTRSDLINGKVSAKIITHIPIGIDVEKFKPFSNKVIYKLRKKYSIPNSSIVITFAGSLTYEKGFKDYLALGFDLIREIQNIYLLIIGDGPLLSWAKKISKDPCYDSHIIFTGFIEDIREPLGISNILLFPTKHNEGISLSILEALSMKVIVISTDIKGVIEVIENNNNGFIFKKINYIDIKHVLSNINNYKMHRITTNGRMSILSKYNIEFQSRKIEYLFRSL